MKTVEIVPYNACWPDLFRAEAARIQKALGPELREIYHIGSTSIPNMPAKPVVDLMLSCENLDAIGVIAEKLANLNYYGLRRSVIPHRSFFARRESAEVSFNLHIRERGDPQINRHVNFRDYISQHPEEARAYASLKKHLAEKYPDDLTAYVKGKEKWVQEIDAKAKQWPERKRNYLLPPTGPAAQDWAREKLVKAMEANMNVHMTHFAQYLDPVELVRIPGFTIVNSGLPDDTFNYVLEADFTAADAEQKIEEVTHFFQQRKVPFSWWVSPYDRPQGLPSFLEKQGYVNAENSVAMYFDLDAWDGKENPHPRLEIVQARDAKTLLDFARVLAPEEDCSKKYFSWVAAVLTDEDPIEYYVGYVDGKPVVRGLSCYFAQVAGLHWLSTHPSERQQGYGRAMQEFRLKRAKELGYHIAVLQASSEGYPLYKKLGYKECGVFREFKLVLA